MRRSDGSGITRIQGGPIPGCLQSRSSESFSSRLSPARFPRGAWPGLIRCWLFEASREAGANSSWQRFFSAQGSYCVTTAQATKEARPTNGMTKSAAVVGRSCASAHAAAILDNNTIGATNQNLGVAVRYRQNGAANRLPRSTNENWRRTSPKPNRTTARPTNGQPNKTTHDSGRGHYRRCVNVIRRRPSISIRL